MLWGITDGSAGMRSQVEGVLNKTGKPYQLLTLRRKNPFAKLPIRFHRGALSQLEASSDPLPDGWPEAVVSSGRRSAALALEIKRLTKGRSKVIHLTDPRSCRGRFDLIIPLQHDAVKPAGNVMETRFALHRLTQDTLQQAAQKWQPFFADIKRPYMAVLIGGSTNKYTLTEAAMREVAAILHKIVGQNDVSLLITCSRRTNAACAAILKKRLSHHDRIWFYEPEAMNDNPYLGMLGLADWVMVTDDSVNMMSEAVYTGKPLYILPLVGHTNTKPAHFAMELMKDGIARQANRQLECWSYDIPDERQAVAERIRQLLD